MIQPSFKIVYLLATLFSSTQPSLHRYDLILEKRRAKNIKENMCDLLTSSHMAYVMLIEDIAVGGHGDGWL
jgi:hypothetical protein